MLNLVIILFDQNSINFCYKAYWYVYFNHYQVGVEATLSFWLCNWKEPHSWLALNEIFHLVIIFNCSVPSFPPLYLYISLCVCLSPCLSLCLSLSLSLSLSIFLSLYLSLSLFLSVSLTLSYFLTLSLSHTLSLSLSLTLSFCISFFYCIFSSGIYSGLLSILGGLGLQIDTGQIWKDIRGKIRQYILLNEAEIFLWRRSWFFLFAFFIYFFVCLFVYLFVYLFIH